MIAFVLLVMLSYDLFNIYTYNIYSTVGVCIKFWVTGVIYVHSVLTCCEGWEKGAGYFGHVIYIAHHTYHLMYYLP